MSTDYPNFIAHYTSLEALLKILHPRHKSEDKSIVAATFLASHIASFEDYSEGTLPGTFREWEMQLSPWFNQVRTRVFGPDDSASRLNSEITRLNAEHAKETESPEVYVVSFSGVVDDLAMWRLYGDNGKGICLVFEKQSLLEIARKHQYMASEIAYTKVGTSIQMSQSAQMEFEGRWNQLDTYEPTSPNYVFKGVPTEKITDQLVELYEQELSKGFFDKTLPFAIFSKTEQYALERETRIAYLVRPGEAQEKHVSFFSNGRMLVPKLPFTMSVDELRGSLKSIVFGPGTGFPQAFGYGKFESMLRVFRRNYSQLDDVEIRRSNIPYYPNR